MGTNDDRRDRVEGEREQATGAVKEDLGKLTDNERLETEGRIEQAEGTMKEGLADAGESVSDAASDAKRDLRE